jgi:hypothetical protein
MSIAGEFVVAAPSRQRVRAVTVRAITIICVIAIGLVAAWQGWKLRQWTWNVTEPIRFVPDMDNAYTWGSRAVDDGFIDLYDVVVASQSHLPPKLRSYVLDYGPLRLLVMTEWVAWTRQAFPGNVRWQNTYAFNQPLLALNSVLEFVGAVFACLLTRLWVLRSLNETDASRDMKAWLYGVLAGLLLWFNPAMFLSGHGRPTWDVWIVPFYLGAVYLACVNGWFWAGVLLAIGTMLKGQQLMVASVFILWPLFKGDWRAALRWIAGFVFGGAVIVAPWMLSRFDTASQIPHRVIDWPAILWVAGCGVAVLLVALTRWINRRMLGVTTGDLSWTARGAVGVAALALLIWPLLGSSNRRLLPWTILPAILLVVVTMFKYRRAALAVLVCGVIAVAIFSTASTFRGSLSWYEIAWRYGADKFQGLEAGGTTSVAGIAALTYRNQADEIAVTLPWWKYDVTWKHLLMAVYVILMVVCAAAMAWKDRKSDRSFLLAMAAPWVMWFAFAPMMHERYLLFGAAAMATCIALGAGPTLLFLFMSFVSWMQGFNQILHWGDGWQRFFQDRWPGIGGTLREIFIGMIPGMGWAVALAAFIVLYLTLQRGQRPDETPLEPA